MGNLDEKVIRECGVGIFDVWSVSEIDQPVEHKKKKTKQNDDRITAITSKTKKWMLTSRRQIVETYPRLTMVWTGCGQFPKWKAFQFFSFAKLEASYLLMNDDQFVKPVIQPFFCDQSSCPIRKCFIKSVKKEENNSHMHASFWKLY